MGITEQELAAVRNVLNGTVSRAHAAEAYSLRESTLVAVTVLTAADKTTFSRKGEYGELLEELTHSPATPEGGWPRDKYGSFIWPQWYDRKWADALVRVARRLGLHVSQDRAGNYPSVVPQEQLLSLVSEDRAYIARAIGWYQEVAQVIEDRRAKQRDFLERRRKMRRDLRRHPDILQARYLQYRADPDRVRRIYRALGKILDKYFPEAT